jgi:hypothetical protein
LLAVAGLVSALTAWRNRMLAANEAAFFNAQRRSVK